MRVTAMSRDALQLTTWVSAPQHLQLYRKGLCCGLRAHTSCNPGTVASQGLRFYASWAVSGVKSFADHFCGRRVPVHSACKQITKANGKKGQNEENTTRQAVLRAWHQPAVE